MKDYLLLVAWTVLSLTLGYIANENHMANNCARDGNAHAWFNEIKCEVSK